MAEHDPILRQLLAEALDAIYASIGEEIEACSVPERIDGEGWIPKAGTCEPEGAEQFCARCGMGAMAHSLAVCWE